MRIRGFAALYTSATLFAFVTLFVKLSSRYYSPLFVSGLRFVIGAVLCLVLLYARYGGVKPTRLGVLVLRGLFGSLAMVAIYAAISLTGPGRAAILGNAYPVFVALFGALFFHEKFSGRTAASLALCTLGAVLVVRDGSGASLLGDFLAIGEAVLSGLAINYLRLATKTENPILIYLSPCVFGLPVLAFAPLPAASGGPVGLALVILGVGTLSFVAQILMTYGYKTVPAGRGSVVFYWETAFTVLLGFLVAGERFNARFLAGLVLILGGLWWNRERRADRAESAADRGEPDPDGAEPSEGRGKPVAEQLSP